MESFLEGRGADLGIRRLPVYLLIDCSGSMVGSKIDAVNYGLKQLQVSMLSDPRMVEMAYISIIPYATSAYQEPLTSLREFTVPTLGASGASAMGAAIHLLAASIMNDVVETGPNRKGDYRPLAFLFTDGQPTDDFYSAVADLHALKRELQPTIYAFGFGTEADSQALHMLTDSVFLLPALTPQGIIACLAWVASCVSKLLNTFSTPLDPSRPLQLPFPTDIPGLIRPDDTRGANQVGDNTIGNTRAQELAEITAKNLAAGLAPYNGVRVSSPAELKWILHRNKWSGELYSIESNADLRGAILDGLDLSGVRLARADLGGARFAGALLVGADFVDARLIGADLVRADCSQADFSNADLTGAKLELTNLSRAKLEAANLSNARLIGTNASRVEATMVNMRGTLLRNVDLSGANLRETITDRTTRLIEPVLDTQTCLGDMQLSDIPLTRILWQQIPRLGDERLILEAKRRDRSKKASGDLSVAAAYRSTARAYRGLSIALRSQGLLIAASNYRLREQVLERKASFREGRMVSWIFSWLLFIVAGYGERPARSFAAYLLVLLGFTAAYLGLGSGVLGGSAHHELSSPLAALIFSVTSFHGRGFFPGSIALGDPIAALAAAEAVLGLFIEITFIAAFTQRFFAR